jgi:hypothetical protein
MPRGLLQRQDAVRRGPLQALLGPHGARAARGPRAAVLHALCLQRDEQRTLDAVCAGVGVRFARTARLRVAAGVLRDQLPTTVAEHVRAQQHRRGHLRPLRHGAWEAGRAKHVVTTHSEKIHRETYTFRTSPY